VAADIGGSQFHEPSAMDLEGYLDHQVVLGRAVWLVLMQPPAAGRAGGRQFVDREPAGGDQLEYVAQDAAAVGVADPDGLDSGG
jgi:hypothetical protein